MSCWVLDAGPLIFLAKINRLELLPSYAHRLVAPRVVWREILVKQDRATALLEEAASEWLEIIEGEGESLNLPTGLGDGEKAVLSWAEKLHADKVVLDDLSARRLARRLGFEVIGTVGILLAARLDDKTPSLRRDLRRLQNAGFFIADSLIQAALQAAGEGP